jgi:RNA 2',3'-cyclic 3'-phosphodiesterase
MLRTFFAVNIGESTRISLSRTAQHMRQSLQDKPIRVTWVEPKSMHITLRFIGDTEEKDLHRLFAIARAATAGIQAFSVKVGGVDFFPNLKSPRVIFCHGEATSLQLIATQLEERLVQSGFAPDKFPHRSHITLGRLRDDRPPPGVAEQLKTALQEVPSAFIVNEIVLYKSEMKASVPLYTPIEKFLLE